MVKHIVMWNLKEFADGRSKEENLREMEARLLGLKSTIEEIQFLEVGISFNESEDAFDIVLYSEFRDRESLELYQGHPEHVKARDFIREVRMERKVVDYEV
ncbi:MAG: Dabb family protein [bacterium]